MSNKYVSKKFASGAQFEEFLIALETYINDVKSGNEIVPKATSATKATQDGNGKNIASTYAKIDDLKNGTLAVPSVNKAALATKAESIVTTNGTILKIFVGTQAEYDALTETERQNVFAIISDDASQTEILNSITELRQHITNLKGQLSDGTFVVGKATSATSATIAESATTAVTATNATNATNANSATYATSAGHAETAETLGKWAHNVVLQISDASGFRGTIYLQLIIGSEEQLIPSAVVTALKSSGFTGENRAPCTGYIKNNYLETAYPIAAVNTDGEYILPYYFDSSAGDFVFSTISVANLYVKSDVIVKL